MPDNVFDLDFHIRPYSDARTFYSPDGRWWCARTYIPEEKLQLLKDGREYTPGELVRLYGLPRFASTGEPGLPVHPGDELPKTVRYVVEPLSMGQQ